ncbi:RHS repeat-associated core domain-containing protein [Streptomyces sp. NPDC052012]|uniref:RHS repeat-associated core domain-containing protein n=1 Tax=Streptomyces sp. NPDC052012 TaxID=3155051 RepID=UPI00344FBEDB
MAGREGFVSGTEVPTGFAHLGARDYDAATGRFISVDPVGDLTDPQQINGYAYSNNNPVTFTDPDGKFWVSLIKLVKAVIKVVTAYTSRASGGGMSAWAAETTATVMADSGKVPAAVAIPPLRESCISFRFTAFTRTTQLSHEKQGVPVRAHFQPTIAVLEKGPLRQLFMPCLQ